MATRTQVMVKTKNVVLEKISPPNIRLGKNPPSSSSSSHPSSNSSDVIVDCEINSIIGRGKIQKILYLENKDDNSYGLHISPKVRDIINQAPLNTSSKDVLRKELIKMENKEWVYINSDKKPRKGAYVYLVRCGNIKGESESIIWTNKLTAQNTLVRQFLIQSDKIKLKKTKKKTGQILPSKKEFLERKVKSIQVLIDRFKTAMSDKDYDIAKKILELLCRYKIEEQYNRHMINEFAKSRFKIINAHEMEMGELCMEIRKKIHV